MIRCCHREFLSPLLGIYENIILSRLCLDAPSLPRKDGF